MKLTVKTLQQKAIVLDVEPTTTASGIKEKLAESQGFDVASQKLIYSGKILADDQTVEALGVKETDFMVVMVTKAKPAPAAAASSSATPAARAVPATPAAAPVVPPTPAAPAAAAAAPAAPAAAPEAAAGATTATPSPAAAMASDPAFATGGAFETAVANMVEMGYPRDQVLRAMRAAYNNPDRAFEYLMTGIPAGLAPEPAATPARAAAAPAAAAAATPAAAGDPANLFNLAQQQAAAATPAGPAAAAGAAPDMASMFGAGGGGGAQFEQLRQMVQANPQLLQPLLQTLTQANPQLAALVQANPEAFMQMLMGGAGEGGEGSDDEMMVDMDGNPIPAGATTIAVTEEEKAAIDRLVALGFDRHSAIEAFLACDKNEELAANYLFDAQNFE
ncbi:UV excision repair protein rad23 [Blastocladiella emersonii ATCC 22665]|nr:UV excision repair protein rad23 [Blastocladiella emersonii ATCC 22665]